MDPGNGHYFSWLKTNLEMKKDYAEFVTLSNGGQNVETWADVVEAALGIFIIAERVPELNAYLLKEFLPDGVDGWQILHSLSDSIRNFRGWREGSRSKRKKKPDPPRVKNTKWTVTFDPRFSTPVWEFLRPPDDVKKLTRKPRGEAESDYDNLLCVAGHGVQLWRCRCQPCLVVRRLIAQSNPQLRSVMCRREEPEVVFSAEQQADFLCLVETAMQRNDAPDQDEQAPQAASSSMDTTGPTSVDPGSRSLDPEIRDDFECKEVEGVSLREMFYVLRGPQGERLRDSTNLFSTMYKGLYATQFRLIQGKYCSKDKTNLSTCTFRPQWPTSTTTTKRRGGGKPNL